MLLMGLCLYVGNAMKDLLSAPRPFGSEYKGKKVKLIGSSELEVNVYAQVSLITVRVLLQQSKLTHYVTRSDMTATLAFKGQSGVTFAETDLQSHTMTLSHAVDLSLFWDVSSSFHLFAAGIWAAIITHNEFSCPELLHSTLYTG